MGFNYSQKESKRWFVLLFALICMIFAAVDLTTCGGNYACFFINIMILVGCVFGALGAWRMDAKFLTWFIVLCIFYIAFEIGFIIWGFVKNYGARGLLWNFLLVAVLCITVAFARDLRGASGGHAILGDSYGALA